MARTTKTTAKTAEPSWFVKLDEAIALAEQAADKNGLPLTVFKTADTCGWSHAIWFNGSLKGAQLSRTVLPANFFA